MAGWGGSLGFCERDGIIMLLLKRKTEKKKLMESDNSSKSGISEILPSQITSRKLNDKGNDFLQWKVV